ncbi:electron transfer flavoprotein subunit alpha/FixB family protein, partial [Clostridium perfringens]
FEKLPLGENDATVENVEIKFNSNDIRTKIVEIIKEHKDIVDISEANVLVAGGRGIGSEENFKMLKELAEVMNGSIAASRAAVEKGWVDKDYQVGQTGKTVRPNIYVACGISGA